MSRARRTAVSSPPCRPAHRDRALPRGARRCSPSRSRSLQRPGRRRPTRRSTCTSTRSGFLADVASAWSPTGDLGHVQGGQYSGYLFPMGPFFALGDALGARPVARAAALARRCCSRSRRGAPCGCSTRWSAARAGSPHAVAGLLMLLNPYVVVFAHRTSVTLLGYAALPWLLLACTAGCARRARGGGRRRSRSIVRASGRRRERGRDGVAAARAAAARAVRALDGRRGVAARCGLRAGGPRLPTAPASLWWVVPAARAGALRRRLPALHRAARGDLVDHEPVGVAAADGLLDLVPRRRLRRRACARTSATAGCCCSRRPSWSPALLVPALALAGFAWTRALALRAVLPAARARRAADHDRPASPRARRCAARSNFTYNHVDAGAVPAHDLQGGAAGGARASRCLRRACGAPRVRRGARCARPWRSCSPWSRAGRSSAAAALDDQLLWERDPAGLDARRPTTSTAAPATAARVVLPGQLYACYDWGGTVDPILPALTDRPVAARNAVPLRRPARRRPAVDGRRAGQQRRALPASSARCSTCWAPATVVAGADDDRAPQRRRRRPRRRPTCSTSSGRPTRRGAPARARAARGRHARRPAAAARGARLGPPGARPASSASSPTAARVVDGSADGARRRSRRSARCRRGRLLYAGDLGARHAAASRARGGEVVITDSNRRRVLVRVAAGAERRRRCSPPTSAVGRRGGARPVPGARHRRADRRGATTASRRVRAPFSPGFPQFPERRPFAAFDGDPATHWLADRALDAGPALARGHVRRARATSPYDRPAARTPTGRRA